MNITFSGSSQSRIQMSCDSCESQFGISPTELQDDNICPNCGEYASITIICPFCGIEILSNGRVVSCYINCLGCKKEFKANTLKSVDGDTIIVSMTGRLENDDLMSLVQKMTQDKNKSDNLSFSKNNNHKSSISAKEQTCIIKSHEAKIISAKSHLKQIKENGIPFDNPVSGFTGFKWEESIAGRIKQTILLPFVFILIIFLFLLIPFAYISHFRKVNHKKQEIKAQIKYLETNPYPTHAPNKKTLESLWDIYGMEKDNYSQDERMNLLNTWIENLYGKKILESLNLKSKIKQIAENHRKANQPYYEGEEAPHYHFMPPFDELISNLSEELPPYK